MTAGLTLDRLLTASPSFARSLPGLQRAAAAASPLLLLGEPGTGRSALARALHDASPRAGGPCVEVDAGVIPSDLFESELFGHRAGAFTGAGHSHRGRVERAQGGSLVLDHIEELPLTVQPKLLRLLAEQRFAPLGGREQEADVRFLAIGPEDLDWRVEQEAFRADLFYRLEVLAFRLPPLRERRDDLPALLDHFLADLGQRFGRPGLELSERARAWMLADPWPGNLRQLRNVLERDLILRRGSRLDPPLPAPSASLRPRPLAEAERAEIERALAYTRGHQGQAAELLGISRKALWQKRKRFGVP